MSEVKLRALASQKSTSTVVNESRIFVQESKALHLSSHYTLR